MTYLLVLLLCLVIGSTVANILITKKDVQSPVSKLIKIFAALGVGATLFGLFFLVHQAYDKPYSDSYERVEQRKVSEVKSSLNTHEYISIEKKKENFNSDTLTFNEDTITTATIIFTIAGIALGTLGVLWLGHLESTRLQKDRRHDQEVQKDRVLSLLSLGIDLFIYIDKKELDFVYATDDEKIYSKVDKEHRIEWKGQHYFLLKDDLVEKEPALKLDKEKHLASLFEFLYEGRNLNRVSILGDIHRIIEQLQVIFYEEDILLYEKSKHDNFSTQRDIFIRLLKQYNDYKNFLNGNTLESDFIIERKDIYEKRLSTLLNSESDSKVKPIKFLKSKYDVCNPKNISFENQNERFYEYFQTDCLDEFTHEFLLKDSNVFLVFNQPKLKDVFVQMNISSLDPKKFFSSYFKNEFFEYIEEKKKYSSVDLSHGDLKFEEYIDIFEATFLKIQSDIKSVKELFSLFYSFVKLYSEMSRKGSL